MGIFQICLLKSDGFVKKEAPNQRQNSQKMAKSHLGCPVKSLKFQKSLKSLKFRKIPFFGIYLLSQLVFFSDQIFLAIFDNFDCPKTAVQNQESRRYLVFANFFGHFRLTKNADFTGQPSQGSGEPLKRPFWNPLIYRRRFFCSAKNSHFWTFFEQIERSKISVFTNQPSWRIAE